MAENNNELSELERLRDENRDNRILDKVFERADKTFARKIVETIVFGFVAMVLMGFIGYLIALTWPK